MLGVFHSLIRSLFRIFVSRISQKIVDVIFTKYVERLWVPLSFSSLILIPLPADNRPPPIHLRYLGSSV